MNQEVEQLVDNLIILDKRLDKAKEDLNLSLFDKTVDAIRLVDTQLNNSIKLTGDEVKAQRERYPRGSVEVEHQAFITFHGMLVSEYRAQLVKEAKEEGLIPKIETKRINCWSSPRNVSTAIMDSFAKRSDTRVFDEVLYGAYLQAQNERAENHPESNEVISSMLSDKQRIVDEVILGPHTTEVAFFKQMTHHLFLADFDRRFLAQTTNIILTRNPRDMIPSMEKDLGKGKIDIHDTGYAHQLTLFNELRDMGQTPIVIDAKLFLDNPKCVLKKLCSSLQIEFEEPMLKWPVGAKGHHGQWGKYWYSSVVESNGFSGYMEREAPEHLLPLVADCMDPYNELVKHALRA